MVKEEIKKLTNRQLQKRKKLSTAILIILITAAVLNGALVIYDLIIGDGFNSSLFIPAIACLVIALPIALGKNQIKEEMKNRENL
jgi:predicted permease